MYRAVSGVCTAEVWTRARTKVSKVALGLVDPFPAKVLSEVDVQRTHAAVLLQVPETQLSKHSQSKERPYMQQCDTVSWAEGLIPAVPSATWCLLAPSAEEQHRPATAQQPGAAGACQPMAWPLAQEGSTLLAHSSICCSLAPGIRRGLPQVSL